MRQFWFDFYIEKLNELVAQGIDDEIADDTAALYADNRIKEWRALSERSPTAARETQ